MKQKLPGLDHWIVAGVAEGERPFIRVIFNIDYKVAMTFLSLCGFHSFISLLGGICLVLVFFVIFSPLYLRSGVHLRFKLLLEYLRIWKYRYRTEFPLSVLSNIMSFSHHCFHWHWHWWYYWCPVLRGSKRRRINPSFYWCLCSKYLSLHETVGQHGRKPG